MSTADAFAAAAIAGLSRSSWRPPDGEAAGSAALRALALAAQRRRLAAPQPALLPVPPAADALHGDPRPILPPESRRALQRLLAGAQGRGERFRAALDRLRRVGWRLHPFDLPSIESQLAADDGLPGPAERAFLRLTGRDVPPPVTADSWVEQSKARKIAWFEREHRRDPEAACRAILPILAKQPADVRTRIARSVASDPKAGDESLLRRMQEDRDPDIRRITAQGLAAIPGTPERATLVAEAARACFRRIEDANKIALLASGGPSKEPPVHLLVTASPVEVAELLGMPPETVLEACLANGQATDCAMAGLLRAGHYDLALGFADRAGLGIDAIEDTIGEGRLGAEPLEVRLDLLRRLFRPPSDTLDSVDWRTIADAVGGTLPADLSVAVTTWPGWPDLRDNPESSLAFVTVAPRAVAEALLTAFEPAPAAAEPARLFLRFLLTLPGDAP